MHARPLSFLAPLLLAGLLSGCGYPHQVVSSEYNRPVAVRVTFSDQTAHEVQLAPGDTFRANAGEPHVIALEVSDGGPAPRRYGPNELQAARQAASAAGSDAVLAVTPHGVVYESWSVFRRATGQP